MTASALLVVLIGLLCACVFVLTLVVTAAAWELRRTLRHVNALLPAAQRAVRIMSEVTDHAQRVLHQGLRLAQRVEQAVESACDATTNMMQPMQSFSHRVQEWFQSSRGVKARPGPRRNGRTS